MGQAGGTGEAVDYADAAGYTQGFEQVTLVTVPAAAPVVVRRWSIACLIQTAGFQVPQVPPQAYVSRWGALFAGILTDGVVVSPDPTSGPGGTPTYPVFAGLPQDCSEIRQVWQGTPRPAQAAAGTPAPFSYGSTLRVPRLIMPGGQLGFGVWLAPLLGQAVGLDLQFQWQISY